MTNKPDRFGDLAGTADPYNTQSALPAVSTERSNDISIRRTHVEHYYADYMAYLAEWMAAGNSPPHCDMFVLHAPYDECLYCSRYAADLQLFRHTHRIAFTGQTPDIGERPCPATVLRPLDSIHHWHGNIPWTQARQREYDEYWSEVRAMLERMDEGK